MQYLIEILTPIVEQYGCGVLIGAATAAFVLWRYPRLFPGLNKHYHFYIAGGALGLSFGEILKTLIG